MGRYSSNPDRPLRSIRQKPTAALPEEILLVIFESVEGPPQEALIRERTDVRVPEEVLAIQNLRLTCRQFNRIASPLLMPTVPVDYRYSSIKRLEQVSSHRLISSGIRTVAVMLQGLDPELVWNSSRFFEEMKETLRVIFGDVYESFLDCIRELKRIQLCNLEDVYRQLYQNQQQLMTESDERGGLSEFSTLVASAMAKMSGQRPRSIEFISAVPPCMTLKHLVPPKSFAGWEGWYGTLAVNISRTALKHYPRYFADRTLHSTVAMVPAALKAAKVQFNLDQMSVKLSGANMRPSDVSGAPLLLDALPFLRPRSFLFDGTGSKVHGATEDPHNQFFAICLLQPSLRRVDFYRRSCFQNGVDWLWAIEAPISQNISQYELWCTRVRVDEPPPRLYNDDDVVPIPKVRGKMTSLNISGGMFKQRDLLAVLGHLPANLDEFGLSDVLLMSPDMADGMPNLGGLLGEIGKCPNCEAHDAQWIRRVQQNLSGFLVAETLQWEKVLDVLRAGKKFGSGKKEESSLPSPLRLRGLGIDKLLLMKRCKLYHLINAIAKIWVPNQRHGTAGNDGEEFFRRVMWNCECQSLCAEVDKEHIEAIMSEEMNAAEKYVMHLRDVNPVTEFRANLLLLSKSMDEEDKDDKDDKENDDDGYENEDEQQDENQDQDEDEDEDEDVEDEDAEDEDAEDEDAEDEDAEDEDAEDEDAEDEDEDEDNDDDDRVFVAGVYIGTRQELL